MEDFLNNRRVASLTSVFPSQPCFQLFYRNSYGTVKTVETMGI